ncbi:uncharacterized protein LOC122963311 [Acropora millepora]|uniref:uncharacterized protein LOC122963311 n=1 Tax=Acropora millepora TaxID=45264 RepID=UPI001CF3D422|nr:uncharacterized protein LOC122963311 [Acropora millepora]
MPSPQCSGASDVEVVVTAPAKKPCVKSADWTEDETHVLLEAWAPKFNKLQGASQREKIKTWNNIYSLYKERCPDSQRTLQQVKKRQQNLDNEYKQLKQQTRSTGEAGIKKIKEGFPYFDIFDEVMGHRDRIDPSKMAIEGSSTFTSEPSVNDASQNERESEPPDDVTEVQEGSVKRKAEKNKQENSGRKGNRRRRHVPESTTQDWQSSFVEMWEKSMEQDNARFEREQSRQIEQTNAILAGFKDIFKDLASK